MNAPANEIRTTFESTTGGVMTVEAGAITGELELATHPADDGLHVKVRYAGAEEWYTVEGSPVAPENPDPTPPAARNLHERVVERLKEPGPVVGDNEEPTSMTNLHLCGDDT